MLAAITVCTPWRTAAQFDDDQVKAAFVLNFLKFVTWPAGEAGSQQPIDVAVIGDDGLARAIERASVHQQIGGRAVAVRVVHSTRDLGRTPALLFIAASEKDRLSVLLRHVEGRPVLTVGDGAGYGTAGVVLNFYVSDTRIRFEANTTAAARAGLQISSHLLRLARIVG
jgi:hypothetical protein